MYLHTLTIEGLRSFTQPTTLNFDGAPLLAITGANHAGKTSILKAVEYALYGPPFGETKTLIARGAKLLKVTLTFTVDGDTYLVERSHNKGGTAPKLLLLRNGTPETGRDVATTQAALDTIIGMGADMARATWLAMQGDVDLLARADGPARRKILVEAFGLDRFDQLAKAATAARKQAQQRHDLLQGRIAGLDDSITLNPDLEQFGTGQLQQGVEVWRRHALLQQTITRCETELGGLTPPGKPVEELAAEAETAQKAASEASEAAHKEAARLAAAETELVQVRASLSRAEKALEEAGNMKIGCCQACGQNLTDNARNHLVEFCTNQVTEATNKVDLTVKAVEKVRAKAQKAHEKFEEVSAVAVEARRAVDEASTYIARHTQLTDTLRETRRELDSLRMPPFSVEVAETELVLRQQQQHNQNVLAGLRDELADAAEALEAYTGLAKAYAPAGIPMMLLESAAAEISREANRILEAMSSPLTVELVPSGASVDITAAGSPWHTLSGQERFFVAVALRLGLASVIAARTGRTIGTLILDEGWGVLDDAHAQAAVEALAGVTDRFQIVTVTHSETVASQMGTRFEVERGAAGSTVTRVG